ncbi:MAG: hypothetical protein ACI90V_009621, partial [Bacillariaceae sp.]
NSPLPPFKLNKNNIDRNNFHNLLVYGMPLLKKYHAGEEVAS